MSDGTVKELPISSVHIQAFKCFEDLKIGFKPLTLLTGHNAGGKSTAIQPLLLLAQGLRKSSAGSFFPLNGPLVRLGTAGDVVGSASDQQLTITVSGGGVTVPWTFAPRAGERVLHIAMTNQGSSQVATLFDTLRNLTFISAVRAGTEDAFPMPDGEANAFVDVGSDGRFAPFWYDQLVDNEVPVARRCPNEPAGTFRKQIDAWFDTLFPGAHANVQAVPALSEMNLQFRLSDIGEWRRPANIGYGLTYSFPILVALLGAAPGQVVIIDSPEAHLHPFAQSQMGRLLAQFSASGVQIVVETHSDHLLNGVRLAVQDGAVSPSTVGIHYFKGVSTAGHGVSSPAMKARGAIDEWPEGFFDQAEKDLALLSGWA